MSSSSTCVESFPTAASADPRRETTGLLTVGGVGVTVALLTFRTTDAGLGWLVTDAVLVLAIVLGFARGRPGTAGWILAGASLWLAGVTAWRTSDWAEVIAVPGSLLTLLLLALASARRLRAGRVADLGGASLTALRAVPAGFLDAARSPARALGAGARHHTSSVARGLLLGAPIACLFALLLSADSGFRSALDRLARSSGDGVELFLWTLATTAGVLVAAFILGRVRSDGVAEECPAAAMPRPYRAVGDAPAPAGTPRVAATGPRVRPLTWAVVLGQVMFVFAVYVLANVKALFEGHAYLRAAGTETYAAYVHTGFMQVSLATLLAVACVFGGHLALSPRAGASRVPGGWGLVAIELGLLAVVGLTLASCVHRLALYGEAYGFTYLRLAVWLFQLGVGGLLTLVAARCVARGAAGFASALAWSALLFMVVAGSLDADGWIARQNVERARAGAPLDTEYLASLSEDARGVLPEVTLLDRDLAASLDGGWHRQMAEHTRHGWRERRGFGGW
jgi:hypothetical protein